MKQFCRLFMQPIQELYPLLLESKKIVITTHQKPDGDAMGSSLGLYHFLLQGGHTVQVISPTNWANFLDWMPGIEHVLDYETNKEKSISLVNEADIVFCLDFNVIYRTKNFAPHIENSNAIKVLIDHHQEPQEDQFAFGISDTSKSSTCEMVFDFIQNSNQKHFLNKEIAACLYTGMMTDTGSFRFNSTTASVHYAIAKLKETGFNHTLVHEHIYDNFLESRLRFIGNALLNRMEVLYEYNTALMFIPKSDIYKYNIKTGDTEGLVNYLHTIQGIKLAAICIDRDEERKWSFRSKGNFDVNTFARNHFEGGGHFHAAGGRSGDSLENTVSTFKQVLKQYKEQLQ